jgi:cold shock protein
MGKYRDHRSSRSERFQEDHELENSEPTYFQRRSEPTAAAPPSPAIGSTVGSPALSAEVLWLNAEKGFGFVRLSDGSDAFLHISKLQAVGQTSLPEGTQLQVLVEVNAKGKPQVSQVVSIEGEQGNAIAARLPNPEPQRTGEDEGLGSVKRYDAVKGFGFIKLEKGDDDVFVHATALTRSGLATLNVGQTVMVRYGPGKKGLEARTIRGV